MQLFQTPASIENVSTRKDNTLKIIVGTQELSAEQKAILMGLHNKIGYFLFKENDISPDEVPEDDAPEFDNQKSLSERLYNVLYVYHKQQVGKGKMTKTFNEYRREKMEQIIQTVKEKLD